VTQANITK